MWAVATFAKAMNWTTRLIPLRIRLGVVTVYRFSAFLISFPSEPARVYLHGSEFDFLSSDCATEYEHLKSNNIKHNPVLIIAF